MSMRYLRKSKSNEAIKLHAQKRAKRLYQFTYEDHVGPILSIRFGAEKYFFTFIEDQMRITETYIKRRKSECFKSLKAFYNLVRTCTSLDRPIEKLRSDYGSELQGQKVDKWLIKQGITFETSALYSQEENGVSERKRRTIMDMMRATIVESGIDDNLRPEIVLAMTYIKNLQPTRALKGLISLIEMANQALPELHHLFILGSNIYVFLHKGKQSLKSANWEARALRRKFVGFNGHTVPMVHIKDQNKVIRVKDLRIFEDITSKAAISLLDFEKKPTFGIVQIPDEESSSDKNGASKEEKNVLKQPPWKQSKTRAGRKKNRVSEEENAPKRSPKKPIKSRDERSIKPTPKSQDGNTIHIFVTQLTSLVNKDLEKNTKVSAFLASFCDKDQGLNNKAPYIEAELDQLNISAASIHKTNTGNPSDFLSSSQLDVEEPKTNRQYICGCNQGHGSEEIMSHQESQTRTCCSLWEGRYGAHQILSWLEGWERSPKENTKDLPASLHWQDPDKVPPWLCQAIQHPNERGNTLPKRGTWG